MIDLMNLTPHKVSGSLLDKIFLFYGAPGTRKTSIAVGDKDKSLLIAFEIGYKFIDGVHAAPIGRWYDFKMLIEQLKQKEVKEKYTTVVIDTLGLAYRECEKYILAAKGVSELKDIPWGQGWKLVREEFEKTIHSIPQMGYGLVLIAHSEEKYDDKDKLSVRIDLDKRAASVVKGLADFILYARKEPSDETGEETVYVYSATNADIEVKTRARFFPRRFEFTYDNLIKALRIAVEKQDDFFGTESLETPDFSPYQEKEQKEVLKKLQDEVTKLGMKLMETAFSKKVETLMAENLEGVRVSETSPGHIPALSTLKDALLEIEKSL